MVGNRISALKARGFLRQITEGARKASLPLRESLLSAQSSVYSPTFAKGRIVVSQSGSGQSGSFQIGISGVEWTQDNVFGLLEELIELHDAVAADAANPVDQTDLDAMFAAMCSDAVMMGVRSSMGDFTALRYPVTR